ncbi:hypothetical protein JCM5350_000968 [Sporobolomyces pararoseus]
MARFGLLDDSEDEVSDASSIQEEEEEGNQSHTEGGDDSTSRSISLPLSTTDDEDEEEDEEDAPPRASLVSDLEQAEEEEEEEEDYSMDEQPRGHSRSSDTSRESRSPSPPPPRRPVVVRPSSNSTRRNQSPWAQQLKLEPKRVQVMQASFFGQSTTTPQSSSSSERESKRRMIVQQGQQSFKNPTTTTTTPIATSQPTLSVPTPFIDSTPFRPYRTYTRVPLKDSIVTDQTSSRQSLVDAGLALGRSYRVGWGTKGEIVSLKGVYNQSETKSDVVKIEKLKLVSDNDKTSALRLLELQLKHSEIYPSCHTDPSTSSSPVPFASPLPTLRFHHFSSLFTTTTTEDSESSTSELSNSPEAQLFKLASHLFDEIPDLHLSSSSPKTATTITNLRRRALLSHWLSTTLLPTISTSLNSPSISPLSKIYLLLTTHQLSKACDLALESNNLRLSTLISQIGTISSSSTDLKFQLDLESQLKKWKEFGIDSNLSIQVRRIYELLSGNLGLSKGSSRGEGRENESKEFHVLENETEWKVAFAMGLWYSRNNNSIGGEQEEEEEEEVARAMKLYEQNYQTFPDKVPSPLPTTHSTSSKYDAKDPIYHLLKLYTCPTHSLEESLSPSNFGNSLTDYRLPWHLYLLFSRVLRKRDFEDRLETVNDDEEGSVMMMTEQQSERERERQGNSVKADQLTSSYAHQLESLGLWEWSVFVLLHLELDLLRAQSIQQTILRNVQLLTPRVESFLIETLKIPNFYLDRARAVYSKSLGDLFSSYKYLLKAQETEKAHEIVVEELGPEALIRGDSNLLKRSLEPFREDPLEGEEEEEGDFRGTVQGWEEGGKVYLQYLHTLSLFSSPKTSLSSTSQTYLYSTLKSLQRFITRINSTEKLKKNKKLRMASSEMSSRLNVLAKSVGGRALSITQPSLLGESDKLVWLQGATRDFLQSSLKKAQAC